MPVPLSDTASRTYSPGFTTGLFFRYSRSRTTLAVSTVTLPPRGLASRALTSRLTMICSTWEGSMRAGQRLPARKVSSWRSSPISRRIIPRSPSTTSFRSITRGSTGCCLLKASRRRIRAVILPAVAITMSIFSAVRGSAFMRTSSHWLVMAVT